MQNSPQPTFWSYPLQIPVELESSSYDGSMEPDRYRPAVPPRHASRPLPDRIASDTGLRAPPAYQAEDAEDIRCKRLTPSNTFGSDFSDTTLHDPEGEVAEALPAKGSLSYTDPTFLSRVLQWTDELWLLLVSLLTFVAIIIVLGVCDARPLASLPITTNPTTILALLTSLCKATLTFTVAQAISQWKWNAFLGQRPLMDIEIFDASSRGAWGSILFLAKVRRRDIVTVGSLVLALSIVTSPITQLVFSFPVLPTPSPTGNATIPASWHMAYPKGRSAIDSLYMGFGVSSGIAAALGDSTLSSSYPMSCDTGNCTYPNFQTLGVCTKTYDISHLLNVSFTRTISGLNNSAINPMNIFYSVVGDPDATPGFYNASLPEFGAFQLTAVPYSLIGFSINDSFVADQESLPNTTFYNMAIIYSLGPNMTVPFTGTEKERPQFLAMQAVFYICVQELESGFVNGVPYTNVVSTSDEVIGAGAPSPLYQFTCSHSNYDGWLADCTPDTLNWDAPNQPIYLRGPESSPLTIRSDNYSIDTWMIQSYQITLVSITWWEFFWDGIKTYQTSTGETRIIQTLIKALYSPSSNTTASSTASPAASFQVLTEIVSQLAKAATDSLRTLQPRDPPPGQFSFLIQGTALENETFIHVVWGWLIFLGAQVIVAIGFVLFTIISISQSGVEVYKSSMLPMLFALNNTSRDAAGPLTTAKEMEDRAKNLYAKLIDGELVIQGPKKEHV
ncbi:hypothetical protein GQ53DRAFT_857978 [Thozetella sp. PMI_491]|nr:hypothetical protein GQ53DRAFT_857978 [Thozetella sp. PMI_491]